MSYKAANKLCHFSSSNLTNQTNKADELESKLENAQNENEILRKELDKKSTTGDSIIIWTFVTSDQMFFWKNNHQWYAGYLNDFTEFKETMSINQDIDIQINLLRFHDMNIQDYSTTLAYSFKTNNIATVASNGRNHLIHILKDKNSININQESDINPAKINERLMDLKASLKDKDWNNHHFYIVYPRSKNNIGNNICKKVKTLFGAKVEIVEILYK